VWPLGSNCCSSSGEDGFAGSGVLLGRGIQSSRTYIAVHGWTFSTDETCLTVGGAQSMRTICAGESHNWTASLRVTSPKSAGMSDKNLPGIRLEIGLISRYHRRVPRT